ncbi:MAG: putative ABC transporter permease, partial [Candidatus Spyradocola sp.]|jgi:uncharacterized membrane protein
LKKNQTPAEKGFAPEAAPQEAYVSDVEAKSRDLLESTERTVQEMEELFPQMLHPEDPDAMDRRVHGELASLRRAALNLTRARQRLFDVRDELGARWNDVRPRRRKRRLRLNTPPNAVIDAEEAASNHFTKGVGLYKLLWVFYLGSFLGVVVEVLWCLLIHGYIESRTALVYGPFNPLYGVGSVALTLALYRYRNRGPWLSFLSGMLVGSAVEYGCSFLQELVLGSRSWDYSHLPFNLNGRICLLYSIFWGALGVLWIKRLYPLMAKWILKIPNRIGKVLTWVILAFFVVDAAVTCLALARWIQRMDGIAPQNALMQFVDDRFTDERMKTIFPGMVFTED